MWWIKVWLIDMTIYGVFITTPQPVIFPFTSVNICEKSRKFSIRLEVKWVQSNPFRYQGRYINEPLNRVHAPVSSLSVHLGSKTINVSSMQRSVCLFKIKTRNHYIKAPYLNSKQHQISNSWHPQKSVYFTMILISYKVLILINTVWFTMFWHWHLCLVSNVQFDFIFQDSLYHNMDIGTM